MPFRLNVEQGADSVSQAILAEGLHFSALVGYEFRRVVLFNIYRV